MTQDKGRVPEALRRLHAENENLRNNFKIAQASFKKASSELEAVGAGGVSGPLMGAQALDARIRNAGGTLANAAFNLSQQGGQVLEERAAKTLKKLQVEWDAAIAAKQGGA